MKIPLICAVIKGPTIVEIKDQLKKAESCADLVEWRLDLFDTLDIENLSTLKRESLLPAIFTLRASRQGGQFRDTESERLQIFEKIIALSPEYVDIEADVTPEFVTRIKKAYPKIKLIASTHDFTSTPNDLESVLQQLKRIPADFYKIAVMTHSTLDALRLMTFKKQRPNNLILVGMGETGTLTRIVGPLFGSNLSYVALEGASTVAPGQQKAADLNIYRYHSLLPSTKLYGLIGGNVSRSFGHITHNAAMGALGFNSVYIKMGVQPNEIGDFIQSIKGLNIGGLSVTMPLKEVVIPYLDELSDDAKAIGAVNTILFENGKIIGYNTDSLGALNALEKHVRVKNKKLVILGAGGAARAIAYEAIRRGANVSILNRHPEKALALAKEFGCDGDDLASKKVFDKRYDIIINATPSPMPIDSERILPGSVVMDITNRPIMTPFLTAAKEKKCKIVPGYEMFVEQAVYQFKIWFKESIDLFKVKSIIRSKAEVVLSDSTFMKKL